MKYNRSEIFKRAWEIRRTTGQSMSEALRASWTTAKNTLDATAQNLFRVRAMLKELEKEEAALMDTIKAAIAESGEDCISGYGWKASYKPVTSQRFDSKAFKEEHGDMYAAYSKPQTVNRFLFGAV